MKSAHVQNPTARQMSVLQCVTKKTANRLFQEGCHNMPNIDTTIDAKKFMYCITKIVRIEKVENWTVYDSLHLPVK